MVQEDQKPKEESDQLTFETTATELGPKAVSGFASSIEMISEGWIVVTVRASMTEASAPGAGTAREETKPEKMQRAEVKMAAFILIFSDCE